MLKEIVVGCGALLVSYMLIGFSAVEIVRMINEYLKKKQWKR